jgi:PAS domain S-box-containing protein
MRAHNSAWERTIVAVRPPLWPIAPHRVCVQNYALVGDRLTTDIASIVYAGIFAMLAGWGLIDWYRRRDVASRWFAATFGVLAIVVIGSSVATFAFGDPPPAAVSRAIIIAITLYPPCLLAFTSTFGRIARIEHVVVWALTTALAVSALIIDLPPQGERGDTAFQIFSIAFVLHWTLVSLRSITKFWRSGRRRPGVVRGRARLMAIGVASLTVALILQAADPHASLRPVIAVIAAASAVISLVAYSPPAWLRGLWRRPEQDRLRAALGALLSATTENEIASVLLPTTRDLVGAKRVAIIHEPLGVCLADGYDEREISTFLERPELQPQRDGNVIQAGTQLITRSGDAWVIVEVRNIAQTFGVGERELLASIVTIAQLGLERLRNQATIALGELRWEEAADIAGLGDWEWEVGSPTVTWSRRMHTIFGTDPFLPMTYETYQGLLHPDDRPQLTEYIREALATGTDYAIDHRVVRPDGVVAHVHSRARVITANGIAVRLIGVTQDITERMEAQERLRDAIAAERELTQRLRALDDMKSNILSAVSHELRTPLTSVLGFSITLRDRLHDLTPSQQIEMLDHVVQEAQRLTTLLTDLLDIDRLRRGVLTPNLSTVDLAEVVAGIVHGTPRTAEVKLDLPSLICNVDVSKIERIVENLVVNAEKYASDTPHVWVRIERDGDNALIIVEDDGAGVPTEQRTAIFEPFNRGEQHLGHAPGTGIGLTLVQQFAQLHGGTAHVTERAGGGASFVVCLPDCVDASA